MSFIGTTTGGITTFIGIVYISSCATVSLFVLQVSPLLSKEFSAEAQNFTQEDVPQQSISENIHRILPVLEGKHEGHNGFALAASMRDACKAIKGKPLGKFFTMLGFVDKRILYCPVEKCATTFWRRTFHLLTYKQASPYSNPFAVPLKILPTINKGFTVQTAFKDTTKDNLVRKNSFTFLFVRNPYSRIFSAFVDKLVPPNPIFWKGLGARAIQLFRKDPSKISKTIGYDVTFAEYVKLVIRSLQTKTNFDAHHISMFDKCEPCEVEFDYVGKMESFSDDSMYILKKMGLNSSVELFSAPDVFKDMSAEDAVMDTTTSPFMWKKDIMKTITWETALRRTWLKLQMRGLVDLDQKFDHYVPKSLIAKITDIEFQEIAHTARKNSDPVKLKKEKIEAMREAYLTLHINDVKLLRDLYKTDFKLFNYDDSPSELFDRPDEPENATKYFTYFKWT